MGPIANDAAPALLNALKSTSDGRLKNKFADALKRIGPAAGEDLSTLIQDLRNSDNGIRFSAINALAAKGESAAPVVVKLLADPDKDVRFWSAYLLARHKSSSDGIAVALEKALKDSDQCVRGNVMWALREASPVRVSSHDISDDELAAIDRIVTMKPTDEDIIIHSIYRLDGLKTVFPASVKMDHILFKSGLAKVAVGEMLAETNHKSPVLETYNETHKDDYIVFLGVMYKGGDFKALIEKYPKSPLAADAAYLMARENTKVGECEGDMSCELRSSIGIFISYLRDYPTHSKVGSVVEDINKTVSSLSQDPSRGGLLELFEIDESGGLIKEYHEVVKSLPNPDMRGDALYLLARAYISAAQFEKADQLYSELEANYPKYHNARATAAYQFFDYSEKPSQDKLLHIEELVRLTAPLSDPSEMKRLDALERINHADIKERPLLFSLLLKIGMLSQKDDSPAVRKHAIGAIGALASNTSFFRSVVGYCISHDEDKKNQQYCADLGVNHPNLKSTEFYAFNRDRINENLTEATGKPYPSPEQLAEWRETAIRRDREATSTIVQQATAQRITIFGKEYIIIRNKFRPERVVPLYIAMMLLCGLYCYKIAQRRSADKRFWFIVGMLTAPVSLSYILFIPQRSPK
jgi:HEAT repeat protein